MLIDEQVWLFSNKESDVTSAGNPARLLMPSYMLPILSAQLRLVTLSERNTDEREPFPDWEAIEEIRAGMACL